MKILLYTDGGTRGGNPGEGYGSCCIIDDDVINCDGVYFKKGDFGPSTSNEAEYKALIMGLKAVKDRFGYDVDLTVKTDSALLVGQLKDIRAWKVKAQNLAPLWALARETKKRFRSCAIEKVSREEVVSILGH